MKRIPYRIWGGRLALAGLIPVLFIALMEMGTRAFGWGYPTSFLVAHHVGDQALWITNPFYGYRFFDPLVARNPAPLIVSQNASADVTRVAVLGESAAMGDPVIEFSLARALDKLLNRPGEPRQYECINAAMTAISSPIVVDIARDLMRRDVDVLVVYMGNNEVIGPYGPDTVFTGGGAGPRRTALRVGLTRWRLASVLQAARAGAAEGRTWQGMEKFATRQIAAEDPRLHAVYQRFEYNLDRIMRLAARRGVQVIVCTVAVNLADFPPLGSALNDGRSPTSRADWQVAFEQAIQLHEQGDWDQALALYERLVAQDEAHAEVLYRLAWAQARGALDDVDREMLVRARDLDTQRVRADSVINGIIREVAARYADTVTLVDLERHFADGPDSEHFVDHVHFSINGLYHAAVPLARVLQPDVPDISPADFQERLFYTPFAQRQKAVVMRQRRERPPLLEQWGNDRQKDRLATTIQSASSAMQAYPADVLETLAQARMADYPFDRYYAAQLTQKLAVLGEWERAAHHFDTHVAPFAFGFSARHHLGAMVYTQAGQPEQAAALLLRTGPPYGYYLFDGLVGLLEAMDAMGQPARARPVVEEVLQQQSAFPGRHRLERWLMQQTAP